jgi:pimeloyl-ACP methyl ester carboxylesterase
MDADAWPGHLWPTPSGPIFVRAPRESGIGRAAVLFVHGLGGESLDWADVATELGDAVHCYALDLPGFADSPLPADGDLSLDAATRAVAAIARTIGTPVHLVGNSLGGAIAVRVAAEHPDLVRSLTLISPALPDLRPRFASAQLTIALLPVIGPAIVRAVIRADPEWMAKRIYRLCYGDPKAITPQRHARELQTLRRRAALEHSPLVYRSALRATVSAYVDRSPRRLWRQAAAVGVPALVLFGERDRLVASRVAARAHKTMPDVAVLRLSDVGHVAHLERPQAVADALRTLFARRSRDDQPNRIRGMGEGRGTVVDRTSVDVTDAAVRVTDGVRRVPAAGTTAVGRAGRQPDH